MTQSHFTLRLPMKSPEDANGLIAVRVASRTREDPIRSALGIATVARDDI
jgi:hypothetical protein